MGTRKALDEYGLEEEHMWPTARCWSRRVFQVSLSLQEQEYDWAMMEMEGSQTMIYVYGKLVDIGYFLEVVGKFCLISLIQHL